MSARFASATPSRSWTAADARRRGIITASGRKVAVIDVGKVQTMQARQDSRLILAASIEGPRSIPSSPNVPNSPPTISP